MSTKKKKPAPRRRPPRFELAETKAHLEVICERLERLERNGEQLRAIAMSFGAMEQARERRRVFVLLIGEYLSRPLPSMRPSTVPPWAYTAPEREPQDEPKLERSFMSGTVVVSERDEQGFPARAVVRIEDPSRRLWAPGAWLIAFNGAVLEHVRVGDMAQGNGVASPIVLLNQPIQPAIVVQATVRLETFPESPR